MMQFLRNQSQFVLIFILVVIGASFLLFSSAGTSLITDLLKPHADYGKIDGHELSVAELVGALRSTRDLIVLSKGPDALNDPSIRKNLPNLAWRDLLLEREAEKLHLEITDDEVIKYVQAQPIFQKNGVYQSDLFQQMITSLGATSGITPAIYEERIRYFLRTRAAFSALFSGVHATPAYLSEIYQNYFGPINISVINFDLNAYTAAAQVAPDQVQKEYQDHPLTPEYRTAEKRKIEYVLFKLADQDKNVTKEALGQKALDFALSFQPDPSATSTPVTPPDFFTAAQQKGLTVITTEAFTADTTPTGLPPSPSFNNAAFSLTKEDPISRVVEMDNGFAILHLSEILPSELRPLSEVQPIIEKKLKQTQGLTNMQQAAEKADHDLQQALAKGTDFRTATSALGLKLQTLPVFTPAADTTQKDPLLASLAYTATKLRVGETSHLIPVNELYRIVIFHLDNRAPADPAGLTKFTLGYGPRREEELRTSVSLDWENWRDRQSGTHAPKDLDSLSSL